MKKLFHFDPLKSFISLPVVWGAVGALSATAILFAIIITVNSNLEWNSDYHGVNRIFTIYKLPLTTFALIIPIVALLAANHRSEQTKVQILASNEQNVFANYYKHIEEFEKFIASNVSDTEITTESIRYCHKTLFPYANEGNYNIDEGFRGQLNTSSENIARLFAYFNDGHAETQTITILEIEESIKVLEVYVGMLLPASDSPFEFQGITLFGIASLSSYLSSVVLRIKTINTIAAFDIEYVTLPSIEQILRAKLDEVPDYNLLINPSNPINPPIFELIHKNT
ncbi:MAG: hypothetical protein GQ529_12790 [Methyloprofundus sp.]|nr:hypothetical protein [Methyloprofundus sp.]